MRKTPKPYGKTIVVIDPEEPAIVPLFRFLAAEGYAFRVSDLVMDRFYTFRPCISIDTPDTFKHGLLMTWLLEGSASDCIGAFETVDMDYRLAVPTLAREVHDDVTEPSHAG